MNARGLFTTSSRTSSKLTHTEESKGGISGPLGLSSTTQPSLAELKTAAASRNRFIKDIFGSNVYLGYSSQRSYGGENYDKPLAGRSISNVHLMNGGHDPDIYSVRARGRDESHKQKVNRLNPESERDHHDKYLLQRQQTEESEGQFMRASASMPYLRPGPQAYGGGNSDRYQRGGYQTNKSPFLPTSMKTTKQLEQELAVASFVPARAKHSSIERPRDQGIIPTPARRTPAKVGRVERVAPELTLNSKPVRYVPATPFGTFEDEGQKDAYFIENRR